VPEPSTEARLDAYTALVQRFSTRLNLVSSGDMARFRTRHIDDSLRLLPLLDELPPGPCVDVGSGAGLPGIPLAIAGPARVWRLLEPRPARAAFLDEVVRDLGLETEVLAVTAATGLARPGFRSGHALATARALASPGKALSMILPLVASGGVAAVFLGADSEVPEGAEEWEPGIAIVRVQ
jgi:16S rRNA (guanine527-N7)-methyltransferase